MTRPGVAGVLGLLLVAAGSAGCASYEYPERDTVPHAVRTFHEAMRRGDLPVLDDLFSAFMDAQLAAQREANGDPATAAYYRRDARDTELVLRRWYHVGPELATAIVDFVKDERTYRSAQISMFLKEGLWTISGVRALEPGGDVELPEPTVREQPETENGGSE